MNKTMSVLCVLAMLLMLTVPALASKSEEYARHDLLELDGVPANGAEDTPVPVVDDPVDESTCREEPSAPYVPPERLPGQGEIDDILSYWEENGYPDDVAYAFEAGGETAEDGTVRAWWEIGLVGADEARRQEILGMVSPACLVEFKTCLFTHAQKQTAYDTITELAKTDENILKVIFIRNGDDVWVAVPEERAKEYAEYLIRDLGLGAVVSVTDMRSLASFEGGLEIGINTPGGPLPGMGIDGASTVDIVPAAPAARTSPVLWICLALAVFAACALTVPALRHRFAPAAVTENGAIRAAGAPLTRAGTERAVKDGLETPPNRLFRAIVEREAGESKE